MAVERELKFAVDPQQLPAVRRALAVAAAEKPARATLISTYFDTADGALRKDSMTLRVRREGRRFVQTVKAAAGSPNFTARDEWEDTVAADRPDLTADSATHVAKALAGAEVTPRFLTVIKRTTLTLCPRPDTRIEAAIDEGEIRAAGDEETAAREAVSELELELKEGEPAALYDIALRLHDVAPLRLEPRAKSERGYRLVEGGVRPPAVARAPGFRFAEDATVETVLQEVGRKCLLTLVRNEPAALAGLPDAIHQMRVAVRRLRSTLSAVKPMLSPEHYGWANGALKSLMAAMGAPRDWDVFAQQLLRPVMESLPDEEELARLGRLVERQRRAAYEEARRAISAPESTATILRLARWFEARAWRDQPVTETSAQLVQPIGDLAPTLLARRFRQARKRSRHFDTLPAPARHKLRIALKKLRYTIELLACLFDEDAVHGYIAPLKALQDDLGHLNDVRTAHAILTRLETDAAGDRALGRAGGLILGWHERGLAEQEGRLRKHVRRFRKREPFW